jgi:hypothetical protein
MKTHKTIQAITIAVLFAVAQAAGALKPRASVVECVRFSAAFLRDSLTQWAHSGPSHVRATIQH